MNSKIIEIRDLSFLIADKTILSGITFSVAAAQRLYIVGANGAGKTTLLRCICRIIDGARGEIKILGRDISQYPQKALAKAITYVPQSLNGDIPFTAEEFVLMARYPHLSPFSVITPQDRLTVHEAMELTGTLCFAKQPLSSLSGGERQQVSIAAALAQQAEIFLLDEPTAYLDYKHQMEIHKLLLKINKTCGTTILCITHDLNAALLNADEIVALKNGKIVFSGSPSDIMEQEILEDIYGKKFQFAHHPLTGQKIIVPDMTE